MKGTEQKLSPRTESTTLIPDKVQGGEGEGGQPEGATEPPSLFGNMHWHVLGALQKADTEQTIAKNLQKQKNEQWNTSEVTRRNSILRPKDL